MYSGAAGVMAKMQTVLEKNIYLMDARAETFVPTDRDNDMIALGNYEDNLTGNTYADPAEYYDVIIACNDYLQKLHTYKENHEEGMDMANYEGLVGNTVRIKAWTYFMMAKIYGEVVWFDDTMQELEDYSRYPHYDLEQTVDACLKLLEEGFDGVAASKTMDWESYLATTDDDIASATYRWWNYMVPEYFVLRAELYLWKNDYQQTADILLAALNENFLRVQTATDDNPAPTLLYTINASYHNQSYRLWSATPYYNGAITAMTYNAQKNQVNKLSENFRSAALLLPTDAAIERWEDPAFSCVKTDGTADKRFGTWWEQDSYKKWRLRKYRSSDYSIYTYRSMELYLMLCEAMNHLGRYEEVDALMNRGVYYYAQDKPDVYADNFEGFGKYWVQGAYPCQGMTSVSDRADRTMKVPDTEENIRYNDIEILKEWILEYPGEGKSLPAMIRIARRYNDNSIIADFVCSKYAPEDAAMAAHVRSKLESGDYFVHWDLDSTSSKH